MLIILVSSVWKSDSLNGIHVKPWSIGFRRPILYEKKLSGGLDPILGLNETLIYVFQFVLHAARICNFGMFAYRLIKEDVVCSF